MTSSGTGVLIIRAWIEEGSAQPLRAHIRCTTDIASGVEHSIALSGIEAVRRAVGDWLEEVLTAHPPL